MVSDRYALQEKYKILYVDPLSYNGHKVYNEGNLRALCNYFTVDTLFRENYIDYKKYDINRIFEEKSTRFLNSYKNKNSKIRIIRSYIDQIRIIRKSLNIAKKNAYDAVFFSTVNIIPITIGTWFTKENVIFMDHGVFFAEKHKWIRVFWKLLNTNVKIGALEEYFFEYIKKLNTKNKIVLLRHPLRKKIDIDDVSKEKKGKEDILVFAPSINNNENYIDELFNNEDKISNHTKIIIKGEKTRKTDKLEEYNFRLLDDEYERLLNESDYILIPYDEDYCYRTSGVFFEAVAYMKLILILRGNTLEYYAKKYSGIISLIESVDDLTKIIEEKSPELDQNNKYKSDLKRILEDYNDYSIMMDFYNGVLNEQ